MNYPPQNKCPCGSQMKYIDCCLDRKTTRWEKDENGKAVFKMVMTKEMREIVDEQEKILRKELKRPIIVNEDITSEELAAEYERFVIREFLDLLGIKNPITIYVFLVEKLIVQEPCFFTTAKRVLCILAVEKYIRGNRTEILEPYKETLGDGLYEEVLEMFENYPGSNDDRDKYSAILVDEPVKRMIKTHSPKNLGRNDQCLCGSKKKYKHCCLNKDN